MEVSGKGGDLACVAVVAIEFEPGAAAQPLSDLRERGVGVGKPLALVGEHRCTRSEQPAEPIELRRQVLAFVDDKGESGDRVGLRGALVEGGPVEPPVGAARGLSAIPLGEPRVCGRDAHAAVRRTERVHGRGQ